MTTETAVCEGKETIRKRPAESFYVGMDFSDRIESGYAISGATAQGTNVGVTCGTPSVSDSLVKFRISGGNPGDQGFITVTATAHRTADGEDLTNDETYVATGRIIVDPTPPT